MKSPFEQKFDRDEVLSKCFQCLVENGLEKTTVRFFSLATGLNPSSLYYWFKDKDAIVIEATAYGLKAIEDDLFTRAYDYLNDLDALFKNFPQAILKYKLQLRLIYQVLVSPLYGDSLRKITPEILFAYNSYAKVLADRLGCEYEKLCSYVLLFISVATNFILWEDEAKAEAQYEMLYRLANQMIFDNAKGIVDGTT